MPLRPTSAEHPQNDLLHPPSTHALDFSFLLLHNNIYFFARRIPPLRDTALKYLENTVYGNIMIQAGRQAAGDALTFLSDSYDPSLTNSSFG